MKLPQNAKKVFKGQIFDVYQWPQKMYDGSIATFEALKRPDTVLVIPTIRDKILISEEEQPQYDSVYLRLLGGRNDQDEDPLTCAKRELLEETGMESNNWELFKKYEPVMKIDWSVYVFIAKDCRKIKEQNLDIGEKIQVKEVSFGEFIEIIGSNKVSSKSLFAGDFALDILRLERAGKLDEFKNKLFG